MGKSIIFLLTTNGRVVLSTAKRTTALPQSNLTIGFSLLGSDSA